MQRIGESKWQPLELCYWPDQGALPAKGKEYPGLGYKRVRDKPPKTWPAVAHAMKGKKRKGADQPKQPNPKQPKPKRKDKPDTVGWVGPVSPRGRARKARLKEAASSRIQFVKCFLKGFIRGRNKVKNKIIAHLRLRMGIHHKQRKLASLAVLVLLAKCLLEEEAASVSQQEWGTHKQLVVFFGNAGIGTRGGWGAKAVLQACRKVVERPNSGKPTDRVPGNVVTVDEFRTSRVSSILNSPQPCEEELDSSKPTRPQGWKPKPGQVQDRLLRSAWSKRFEAPVRGLMWCPWLAQATPGDLGKWVDRDCNAALNLQRAGESKWRPLELCRWPHRGRLPAQGKEYPALGFKKLRERAPKAQAQQPVAQ
ncbi:hypothetical protein QJQ45_006740 [Haematococcus lacustris]|nr:hypothetical protein QJQ45_006740 [Haematococcus lacustris]